MGLQNNGEVAVAILLLCVIHFLCNSEKWLKSVYVYGSYRKLKLGFCFFATPCRSAEGIAGWFAIKLPRSTQPTIPSGCLRLRRGTFTCVGWQVTLCDPIWQVTPRSSEMCSHKQLYAPLTANWCECFRLSTFTCWMPRCVPQLERSVPSWRTTRWKTASLCRKFFVSSCLSVSVL